ncbi:MAG TPA: head-tail connector protein [Candidatus Acidoferrales bacterium]|nr:head-tail connector protein [Candidatus Acidoferrales bacterium]HZS71709.1 head-tail connector protein [Candidatus Acidoferrum sp.]
MPNFIRVKEPEADPVTLDEVKQYLRVTSSADDDVLERLIAVATRSVEGWLGRSLIQQQWQLTLDSFPYRMFRQGVPFAAFRDIRLPRAPLVSVDSISYVDAGGQTQSIDPATVQVDKFSLPPFIRPAFGKTWPPTQAVVNAVTILYTCGYADADSVPETIKLAIISLIAHFNENREPFLVNATVQKLPLHIENMLWNERIPPFDFTDGCLAQLSC